MQTENLFGIQTLATAIYVWAVFSIIFTVTEDHNGKANKFTHEEERIELV